ncbi:17862_t:CDS:2 [Acaulospora morrowiae]|uniref:17862_t:CDS:1 n=1 Tax=Acaulospora morrowiae TaxID=94023 RepID=A0A9N9DRA3_9GLOM|nr:17862_t:CDS:2 [Acaulospora morrowiae]
MENVYIEGDTVDEKLCYVECSQEQHKTNSHPQESLQPKEGDDKAENTHQITYISGRDKPKVEAGRRFDQVIRDDGKSQRVKFDENSAKRKEEVNKLVPGWCE